MFALITTFALFAATGDSHGGGASIYNEYFNIPGFELWKFLNLAIFIGILIYVLKKPLGTAFKEKREQIRAELIRAEAEKQEALARVATANERLAGLEGDKENVLARAKEEAAADKKRVMDQTKADVQRLKAQAESELNRLSAQSRAELRRFSAEESVRLAEAKLRSQLDADKDARLVKASISEIGGLN